MIFGCKLFGATLVLAGSMGFAYCLIYETQRHIHTLDMTRQMLLLLQSEVSHRNLSLTEAFAAVSDRLPGAFQTFMRGIYDEWKRRDGTELAVIWREQAYDCLSKEGMTKKELDVLAAFGEQIGFQDRDMQLSQLLMYDNELQQEVARMSEKARETGRIYRLLGIMGGALIIIILI